MRRAALYAAALSLLIAMSSEATARAHGFGERYDLPLPLGLYVGGAGAAVALSFAALAAFSRGGGGAADYPRFNLLRTPLRVLASPWALSVVKAFGVGMLALYVWAGLFGTETSTENLAPALTWVGFWVGLAYFSAFVGNLWTLLNPWRSLFGWADALSRRALGRPLSLARPYPAGLGAWPAVALFAVFAWVEIVDPQSAIPSRLAVLALAYTAITFGGMFWFGRDAWLRHGEVFSIVFGFMARFSPTETRIGDAVDDYPAYVAAPPQEREWSLRWWGSGLLSVERPSASVAALLIFVLASVSFDGLTETPAWVRFATQGQGFFGLFASNSFIAAETFGLLLTPLVFAWAYYGVARAMARLGGGGASPGDLALAFAYSLVPIALAYHVAHFLSFLLIQGQLLIPLASDPLGQGWNLLGTADYRVDIGVINAQAAWAISVAAIVIGHAAAVFAAHVYALRAFPTRRQALRSQYPMLALMVGYTMVSLWIVAQPITEG